MKPPSPGGLVVGVGCVARAVQGTCSFTWAWAAWRGLRGVGGAVAVAGGGGGGDVVAAVTTW